MPYRKFIVQSRHKPGSYAWALDQLVGGNHMRRPHWPYHTTAWGEHMPLFIWRDGEDVGGHLMLGYTTALVGDDGSNPIEGLGTPSNYYLPSGADIYATDWKNADHFDDEERAAVPHWNLLPSAEDIWRQEEATRSELKRRHGRLYVAGVVLLMLAVYTVAGVIGALR
jgi:hypothetical protein